ncbi:translocation/assembly module TamB domain-containing protein [Echinimonas agarilytica]|uniref:Translocation/assembly module TamB domain-containing protein n=1 Tax=Echinimonas agarilytica TaxID=1215918 RepID=A0AA41W5Z4_9GAMM|nr:translocation/assembly module TamB domain-containing protein [Echinimonas agarilytica]MCM2679340.1 translocation/assembly module TamB domain-containing protein [Echinimonas agarilytica]
MSWRTLGRILFYPLFSTLVLLAVLVSTEFGSRLAANIANAVVPMVEIDFKSGKLNQRVELNHFHLDLGFLVIDIEDVMLDWNPWCSVKGEICVNDVQAQRLDLFLIDDDNNSEHNDNQSSEPIGVNNNPDASLADNSDEPYLLELPLVISIENGHVEQGRLEIYDILIEWTDAKVEAYLHDDTIDIRRAIIDDGLVHLGAIQSDKASPPKTIEIVESTNTDKDDEWLLAHVPDTYLPLNLLLPNVQANTFRFAMDDAKPDDFSNISIDANWQQIQVEVNQISATHSVFGRAQISGHSTLSHPYPTQLDISLAPQHVPEFKVLTDSEWQVTIDGSLDELIVAAHEQKNLHWTINGDAVLTDPSVPFRISLAGDQMIWPEGIEPPVDYRQVNGNASGTLHQQRFELNAEVSTRVDDLNIVSKLEAKGQHQNQTVTLDHFSLAYPDHSGGATGHAEVSYGENIQWVVDTQFTNLLLPKFGFATHTTLSGQVKHQGNFSDEQWRLRFLPLDVNGEFLSKPFSAQGKVDIDSHWRGQIDDLEIHYAGSEVAINGAVADQWNVIAQAKSQNLEEIDANLEGSADLTLKINGQYDTPNLQLTGLVKDIAYEGLWIEQAQLHADYQPTLQHQSNATLTVPHMAYQQLDMEYVELKLSGNAKQHQLTLTNGGELQSNIELNGQWHDTQERWTGQIPTAHLGSDIGQWQAAIPINLTVDTSPASIAISAHCWRANESQICLDKPTKLGEEGHLDLSLNIEAGDIAQFMMNDDYDLSGIATGHLSAQWSPEHEPTALLELDSNDISVTYSSLIDDTAHEVSVDRLHIKASIEEDVSRIELSVDDNANKQLQLAASMLHNDDKTLDGQLKIVQYQLGQFRHMFPDVDKMNGTLNADIKLGGMLNKPEINGSANISSGMVELLSNPTLLEDLNLNLTFNGLNAAMNATFEIGGGSATSNASTNWQDDLQAKAAIKGDQLEVLIPPESVVWVSPDLTFTYENGLAKLRGDVTVPQAEIIISKLESSGVELSDDVVFVDSSDADRDKIDSELDMRINIVLGKKIKIDTFGLRSRVEGEIEVRQSLGLPLQMFGNMSLVDGKFAAYGQRLTIEPESIVRFNGAPDSAQLDVRASRYIKAESITAGLHVTGNAEHPKITFYSDPAMEQQEVLSYIVRGRGLDSEGGNGTLGAAAAVGVSAASSLGLGESFEKLPGISDVTLDTEGDGDETQVTISGYIGKRIFLKYGIGVFEPVNEVTVRLYILNQLWLESVSGLEQSLDLYYSFLIRN